MNEAVHEWWLAQPHELPQQGDILSRLPVSRCSFPFTHLEKRTLKGIGVAWKEMERLEETNAEHHTLAKGRHHHVVLLSHDCEMDKDVRKHRIHVAPLAPLGNLGERERMSTLAQKTLRNLPLPGIPELGDHYADLRSMMNLDFDVLGTYARVASMTSEGILRLQAQLIAYFTRRDFTKTLASVPELEPVPSETSTT